MPASRTIPLATVAVLLAAPFGAAADAIGDFYAGKTIKLTIPTPPGASFDLYGRTLGDTMTAHIPGKPNIIPQYRGGAGGGIAAAYMHNVAPKDGTEFGIVLSPTVITPILRDVKWDASKWEWIGSMTPRPAVVTVWHTAPATTLEALKKTPVIMGATNKFGEPYMLPAVMNAFLGTQFKMVEGYQGGADMNLAMEKGETHGRSNYWSGWTSVKADWLRDKKIIQIVQYGSPIKELKDVPSLKTLVKPGTERRVVELIESGNHIGIGVFAPPGTPKDKVAALRKAFAATIKDPAFLAEAEKRKLDIEYVSGEHLEAIMKNAAETPAEAVAKLKAILGV
jgi:tripartite-type tricarboxylate transporter receptor subunit TctC